MHAVFSKMPWGNIMHLDAVIAIIGIIVCCGITIAVEIKANNDRIKAKRDEILQHSQG
jgi:hypothetical protein